MRGVPDHSNEQSSLPSPSAALPSAITLKEPIPEELSELGREVLEMVPRKLRGSLEAYRQAASDLSQILRVKGVRMKPKNLYYVTLRVKWIRDSTGN